MHDSYASSWREYLLRYGLLATLAIPYSEDSRLFVIADYVGCRSPLSFLMSDWREGQWGAFVMGLKHGAYCVGCCWILMALLFVAGVMNLLWVAAIAVLVLVEKIAPRGDLIARFAGAALIVAGIALSVR
ncbi:MAG: DUF2182 domain-containing protein [Chromatiales bacterium]